MNCSIQKKISVMILCSIISFTLFAQRGSIQGIVSDSTEKQKMPFVSAFLFDAKDSSFVKAEITDQKGLFKFDLLYNGLYYVQIHFAMYEKWYSDTIRIHSDQRNVDMGEIFLKPQTNMLQGAEVVFMRPLFEEKPGKLIMNVESHPTAAGDNLFELLRKTPSVTIDNDENILINGKSGVTFLINNRSARLFGDELTNFLKSTSAASVDKVEVINSPSSKYDAEGAAGMINIILKKDDKLGLNGNLYASGSVSRDLAHSEGIHLNARVGKLYVSGRYGYNWRQNSNGNTNKITYFRKDGTTSSITNNEKEDELWSNLSTNNSHSYSLNAEYQLDKKNSFGVSYRGGISENQYTNLTNTRIYTNEIMDSSYSKELTNNSQSFRNFLSLFYRYDFDSTGSHYMEVDMDYSGNNSRDDNLNQYQYYSDDFTTPSFVQNRRVFKFPKTYDSYSFQAYYEKDHEGVSFESGLSSSLVQNVDKSVNMINDQLIGYLTNHFEYMENISSAYFSINTKLDEITDLRAGLRGELSYINGTLLTTSESHSSLYFDLFPNIYFSFKLPKKNNINFGYQSRISRPRFQNLNPFVDVSEQLVVSTGNPLLKPEYSHNFSLGYSWNYALFFRVGYFYTINEYDYARVIDPTTGVTTRFPQNMGKSQGVNGNISLMLPVQKWWNINTYIYTSYGKSVFEYQNRVQESVVYYTGFYFSNNFSFLKVYSFEMNGYYNLPSKTEWGTSKGTLSLNAGFRARLLDKKLSVSLSLNNILNNGKYSWNYTYPDGSLYDGLSVWNSRTLSLRLSYSFGKQFETKKKMRNGDQENGNGNGGNTPPVI